MILARNAKTFDRLKRIIMKGMYDKEEMLLDMADFLEIGTLTNQEYSDLAELMEEFPPAVVYSTIIDSDGKLVSNNTYLLLCKQIDRQTYKAEVIEQIVTDFRITGAIDREQFKYLLTAIEEKYYPVVEEVEVDQV